MASEKTITSNKTPFKIHNRHLAMKLQALRHDAAFADVTFQLANGSHFNAHKAVLSQYSDVLASQFTKLHAKGEIDTVLCSDIDPEQEIPATALNHILDYMYGWDISIGHEDIEAATRVAIKLNVTEFVSECSSVVYSNENTDEQIILIKEEHVDGDDDDTSATPQVKHGKQSNKAKATSTPATPKAASTPLTSKAAFTPLTSRMSTRSSKQMVTRLNTRSKITPSSPRKEKAKKSAVKKTQMKSQVKDSSEKEEEPELTKDDVKDDGDNKVVNDAVEKEHDDTQNDETVDDELDDACFVIDEDSDWEEVKEFGDDGNDDGEDAKDEAAQGSENDGEPVRKKKKVPTATLR